MTVQIAKSWVELARYLDSWADLLERSSSNQLTLSPMWMEAWWRVFGGEDGRMVRAALVYQDQRLIGLAPLLTRPARYRNVLPLRRIELLASGERQEDEICSDYIGFIAERGQERAVARAVVRSLLQGELGPWDELVLDFMDGHAAMTEHVIRQLRRACVTVELTDGRPCPYVPLPATWDEYLAQLSSSDRYLVRRTLRDLHAWAGGDVVLERVESRADLERGQRILFELHGQRWEDASRPGVFASDKLTRFHRLIMPQLLDRNQLDLMWLRCKGEPIAAVYNLIWNNQVYFYQSGRRPELPGKIRPGIAMHAYAIQHSIRQGRSKYDFMAGASRYKRQLAVAETPLVSVRAVRPGSPAALAMRWARAGEDVVRALRQRLRERRAHSAARGSE